MKLTTFDELDERQVSGWPARTTPPRVTARRPMALRELREYKPRARSHRAPSWLRLLLTRA
ncbi:MAG TPA: hypothetical protein VFC24_17285 [Casimicrobiaceae bacterium]|nr:hypothetical protein [Casimicrobiaceae bacterium]